MTCLGELFEKLGLSLALDNAVQAVRKERGSIGLPHLLRLRRLGPWMPNRRAVGSYLEAWTMPRSSGTQLDAHTAVVGRSAHRDGRERHGASSGEARIRCLAFAFETTTAEIQCVFEEV
jgi:hypothetical protein